LSHVEYAPHVLSRLEKGETDRQTVGQIGGYHTKTLRFPLDVATIIMVTAIVIRMATSVELP